MRSEGASHVALVVKNPPANVGGIRDVSSIPGLGGHPGGGNGDPTPVFLSEESHGQKSLVGYSLWGCKELDKTEATEPSTQFTRETEGEEDGRG